VSSELTDQAESEPRRVPAGYGGEYSTAVRG
jgi:hypothetical protein